MLKQEFCLCGMSNKRSIPAFKKFWRRWADIQIAGEIDMLDQGIDVMVDYAKQAIESKTVVVRKDALEELECASFATTRGIRKILAYNPGRFSLIPFDVGNIMCEAVGQFLLYTPHDIRWAILRGVRLLEKCGVGIVDISSLTPDEIAYQAWVTPHLVHHLIPYANDDSD